MTLIRTPLDDAYLTGPMVAAIILITVLLVVASALVGGRK